MNKTCYGHCHSSCSVLRATYQLGLPLIEQDTLLRVIKEITNTILLFLFHYIQTHAYNHKTRTKCANTNMHVHTHTPHIGYT